MSTTNIEPRNYWGEHSDAELLRARDEYRENVDALPWLGIVADDIDDEMARREAYRARLVAQGQPEWIAPKREDDQ